MGERGERYCGNRSFAQAAGAGSWELGSGSWELGAGSWELELELELELQAVPRMRDGMRRRKKLLRKRGDS